jgi:hypothetical protein
MKNEKKAERLNVITESENKNFVHAIINAVTKGYSDRIVFDDIVDLVRRKEISKGVLIASPSALRAYGESYKKSLDFLADKIESIEVTEEPAVKIKEKKQEENVVEEEIEKIEENSEIKKDNKQASNISIRFAKLNILEDDNKYNYNENENKMSGIINLRFNQDMSQYLCGKEIKMVKEDIESILNRIFNYYKNEYKQLKANLNTEIFKTNIKFTSVEKGEAELEYEIDGAF